MKQREGEDTSFIPADVPVIRPIDPDGLLRDLYEAIGKVIAILEKAHSHCEDGTVRRDMLLQAESATGEALDLIRRGDNSFILFLNRAKARDFTGGGSYYMRNPGLSCFNDRAYHNYSLALGASRSLLGRLAGMDDPSHYYTGVLLESLRISLNMIEFRLEVMWIPASFWNSVENLDYSCDAIDFYSGNLDGYCPY